MLILRSILLAAALTFCATSPCGRDSGSGAEFFAASAAPAATDVSASRSGEGSARAADALRRLPRAWSVSAVLESLAESGSKLAPAIAISRTAALDTLPADASIPAGPAGSVDSSIDNGPTFFMPRLVAYSAEAVARINQRLGLRAALGVPRDEWGDNRLMVGLGIDLRF